MPLFYIRHRTHYIYSGLVIDSANQIKLYPAHDDYQRVNEHHLHISMNPPVSTVRDYFGNLTGFFTLLVPHKELVIDSLLAVEIFNNVSLQKRESATDVWRLVHTSENQLLYHDFLKAEEAKCQTVCPINMP